jgi:hypothetical protein
VWGVLPELEAIRDELVTRDQDCCIAVAVRNGGVFTHQEPGNHEDETQVRVKKGGRRWGAGGGRREAGVGRQEPGDGMWEAGGGRREAGGGRREVGDGRREAGGGRRRREAGGGRSQSAVSSSRGMMAGIGQSGVSSRWDILNTKSRTPFMNKSNIGCLKTISKQIPIPNVTPKEVVNF